MKNFMNWEEVRKTYPDKFVKLQILDSHLEGNIKIIDDMAVIKDIDDNKTATKELINSKEYTIVYHTANENIDIEIKNAGCIIFNIRDYNFISNTFSDIELAIINLQKSFLQT